MPLDKRRPIGHFIALWTTFAAGFSFLFVGTEIHDAGFTLPGTIGVTLLGIGIYFAYAIFGAYLGSRTGQTHSLLTRSIFGVTGSYIVSALLVVGSLGWVGFQGGLMVQIWNGLYGWGCGRGADDHLLRLMIFNNLFGFTGISAFARYVVTPLIMLWVVYLVIRGIVDHSALLGHHPKNTAGLTFWQVVGVVIGLRVVGQRARRLPLRQAEVHLADPGVRVRAGWRVPAVHRRRMDDGRVRRLLGLRRGRSSTRPTSRCSARSGWPGSWPRSASSRSTTATTTKRSTRSRTSSAAGASGSASTRA